VSTTSSILSYLSPLRRVVSHYRVPCRTCIMRFPVYRLAQPSKLASRSLYSPRFSPLLANLTQPRQLHATTIMSSPAKRKAEKDISPPKPKKTKPTTKTKTEIPAYHLTPSRQDESGENVWPARKEQIERAREIIREWYIKTHSMDVNSVAKMIQC
jgi:hypothetical protein